MESNQYQLIQFQYADFYSQFVVNTDDISLSEDDLFFIPFFHAFDCSYSFIRDLSDSYLLEKLKACQLLLIRLPQPFFIPVLTNQSFDPAFSQAINLSKEDHEKSDLISAIISNANSDIPSGYVRMWLKDISGYIARADNKKGELAHVFALQALFYYLTVISENETQLASFTAEENKTLQSAESSLSMAQESYIGNSYLKERVEQAASDKARASVNKRHEPSHLIKKDFEIFYKSRSWPTKKAAVESYIDKLGPQELEVLSPMSVEEDRRGNAFRVLPKVIRGKK